MGTLTISWWQRLGITLSTVVLNLGISPSVASATPSPQPWLSDDEIMGREVYSIKIGDPEDPTFGTTIAKHYFPTQDHAFLTGFSSSAWPDALSIGPVAGRDHLPVFITKKDGQLPSADETYVNDQIKQLTIIGGPSTVSPEVESYWRGKGKNVLRIAGESRYETAAKISKTFWPTTAATVLIARADDPADALSAQPLGAIRDAPMILTDRDRLPEASEAELRRLQPQEVILFGGEQAIHAQVETSIKTLLPNGTSVRRVAGDNRYATSEHISSTFFNDAPVVFAGLNHDSVRKIKLATGAWADMFQLAPVAGLLRAPLYLRSGEYDYLSLPLDRKVYAAHFSGLVGWITSPEMEGWGSVEGAWRQAALIRARKGLETKKTCTGSFTTRWRGWGGTTYQGDGSIWSSSWNVNNFLDSPAHMNVLLDNGTNFVRIIDETLRESHGDKYDTIDPRISQWMDRRGLAIRVGTCIESPTGQTLPIRQHRIGPNELTP